MNGDQPPQKRNKDVPIRAREVATMGTPVPPIAQQVAQHPPLAA